MAGKNQSDARKMRRMAKAAVLPSKQARAVEKSYADAEAAGRRRGRQQALDYLHKKFVDPAVAIDGAEGKAILTLAKGLAEHFRTLDREDTGA